MRWIMCGVAILINIFTTNVPPYSSVITIFTAPFAYTYVICSYSSYNIII